MKGNKALKRLAKIDTLMSDVAKRFSAHTPNLREVFEELKTAVDRATEAVKVQVASAAGKKKTASSKKAKATVKAAAKAAPLRKKRAAKKAIMEAATTKSAKKRSPAKKIARKRAAHAAAIGSARIPPRAETGIEAKDSAAAPV